MLDWLSNILVGKQGKLKHLTYLLWFLRAFKHKRKPYEVVKFLVSVPLALFCFETKQGGKGIKTTNHWREAEGSHFFPGEGIGQRRQARQQRRLGKWIAPNSSKPHPKVALGRSRSNYLPSKHVNHQNYIPRQRAAEPLCRFYPQFISDCLQCLLSHCVPKETNTPRVILSFPSPRMSAKD